MKQPLQKKHISLEAQASTADIDWNGKLNEY